MKEKNITMRTIGLTFLLVALALSPTVFADAGHNDRQPVSDHRHNAAAPHAQSADVDHHVHSHPHKHSLLQWLHNVLFGHFHHDDARVPVNAIPARDDHKGNSGGHVLPHAHTDHGGEGGHHLPGYDANTPIEHDRDCIGIR